MSSFSLSTALLLVALGFAVGAFGTLVGAGGGFILTPVLLLVYPDSTPALITAISLFVVFFNASSGTVAYGRQRRIDYRSGTFHGGVGLRRAAALSVGVVFGAQLGAWLSQRLSGRLIERLLTGGLLALGIRLVLSALL